MWTGEVLDAVVFDRKQYYFCFSGRGHYGLTSVQSGSWGTEAVGLVQFV